MSGPWSPLPETLEVRGADGPFAIRVRRVLGTVPMLRIPLDAFTIGAGPDDAPDAAGEPVIASFAWHSRRALLLDPDALRVADPGRQRAVCNHRPPHAPAAAGMPCLCGSLPAALLIPAALDCFHRAPPVKPDRSMP